MDVPGACRYDYQVIDIDTANLYRNELLRLGRLET